MSGKRWLAAFALALAAPMAAHAQSLELAPSGRFAVYANDAAATPPMGWNPWNAFRTEIDEAKVRV